MRRDEWARAVVSVAVAVALFFGGFYLAWKTRPAPAAPAAGVVKSICLSPDPEDCKDWEAPTVCNPLPWTTMAGTASGPTWVSFDGAHWYCLNDPGDGRLTCWRNGR